MENYQLFTGGYSTKEDIPEIASLCFDGKTLTAVDRSSALSSPSFLTYAQGTLYAAQEYEGGSGLGVLQVDDAGGFGSAQSFPLPGKGVCHVSKMGGFLCLSGYGGGDLTVCRTDGTVCSFLQRKGSSVNLHRQESSHVHSSQPSPNGKFLLAADLGTDSILKYRLHPETGELTSASLQPELQTPPGEGPRHFTFAPARNILYVVCELSCNLLVYQYEPDTMVCTLLESHPMDLPGEDELSAADIHLSADGRTLYASVRGSDLIYRFQVLADGRLQPRCSFSSGGKHPRNFAISPDDRFLAVANMHSGKLVVYSLEEAQPKVVAEYLQPMISCVLWK